MNLTEIRNRVRKHLQDGYELEWDDATLDEAIRQSLDIFSRFHPRLCEALVPLPAGKGPGAFAGPVDLSGLPGLIDVVNLTAPQPPVDGPARLCRFQLVMDANAPRLNLWDLPPDAGLEARVVYTAGYTLEGLDGAAETNLSPSNSGLLVLGAYAHALKTVANRAYAVPMAGFQKPNSAIRRFSAEFLEMIEGQVKSLNPRSYTASCWNAPQ